MASTTMTCSIRLPTQNEVGQVACCGEGEERISVVLSYRLSDGGSDAVVAAIRVADADHQGERRSSSAGHSSSTVSLRKCVEQEMHGS